MAEFPEANPYTVPLSAFSEGGPLAVPAKGLRGLYTCHQDKDTSAHTRI